MKTFKKIVFSIALLGAVTFFSCKKSSDTSSTTPTSKAAYQKRWDISSANVSHRPAPSAAGKGSFLRPGAHFAHRPTGSGNYVAIEFLINSYVIFYADGTVLVGQYSAPNDSTLVLDSLGTLHIASLSPSAFSFTIKTLGDSLISITATPAPAIGSFGSLADSALISNTWKIDSVIDVTTGYPSGLFDNSSENDASFSQYGTYLVRTVNPDGTEEYDTNTWLWSNTAHNQLCYGSWDGTSITDCANVEGAVSVSLQAPYTHLVLQEVGSNVVTYGIALRYYLEKK